MIEAAIRAEIRAVLAEELPGAVAEAMSAMPCADGLATRESLAQYLQISTRSLDTLRAQGLPVVWVLDSPRFDISGEVLPWLRSRGAK